MFEVFFPSYTGDSAYDIPYEELYDQGMRGIIFDIDNTLVEHGAAANEKAVALFRRLKNIGYDTVCLSNNKEPRVEPFAKAVGTKYIYKADKPSRKGYELAMKQMGTTKQSTFFVGDQLFTDVYGANRTGIVSYLVKPIGKKEEIQIVLKRYLEKIVLWFYERKMQK